MVPFALPFPRTSSAGSGEAVSIAGWDAARTWICEGKEGVEDDCLLMRARLATAAEEGPGGEDRAELELEEAGGRRGELTRAGVGG